MQVYWILFVPLHDYFSTFKPFSYMSLDVKALKKARQSGGKGIKEEVEPMKKRYIKFGVVIVLYLAFLFWLESWLGLIVIPFIYDAYVTKKIPWGWWRNLDNTFARTCMSWVDAIVFALVAVYFVNNFFFQNYVIPSSSLEKSLLTGDYLLVSKVSYGPRIPQTPLTMPLTQHTMTIPFVGLSCQSYIETPHWEYRRVKGFGKVELGDIVVFNYPAGDTVAINFQNYDFYRLCAAEIGPQVLEAEGKAVKPFKEMTTWQQRCTYDELLVGGRRAIQSDKFRFGDIVSRPADRRENYVKRCVGLPGQTLEIRNKIIYNDGVAQKTPQNAQFAHWVYTKEDLTSSKFDDVCNELLISDEDRSQWNMYRYMPLTTMAAEGLMKTGYIDSIKPVEDTSTDFLYPLNHDYGWTCDNYGPIHIPAKGETIKLNAENIAIYERPIRVYEENDLEIRKDGTILINGKAATSYTFKMDYYWMMGDNRHNSADSRYWGFVPEDHIVGKPQFIWLSVCPDKYNNYFLNVRWNRLFKMVDDIK